MNLRKIIREELGGFDWVGDIEPSLKNTIIVFEPMINKEEFDKVIELLEEMDGNLCVASGGYIRELNPFKYYEYIHHLIVDIFGRVVYGAGYFNNNEQIEELRGNAITYISRFRNKFENPNKIDGREFFNI